MLTTLLVIALSGAFGWYAHESYCHIEEYGIEECSCLDDDLGEPLDEELEDYFKDDYFRESET